MSAQWCPAHWSAVRKLVEAGTHNGVVATIVLFQKWHERALAAGRITADMTEGEKNGVLYQDAPLCCKYPDDLLDALEEANLAKPGPLCLLHLVPKDVCPCTHLGPLPEF